MPRTESVGEIYEGGEVVTIPQDNCSRVCLNNPCRIRAPIDG